MKPGDKLTWITFADGKIQFMAGHLKEVVGDSMKVIGKNVIGVSYSDILGINDKTVVWTKQVD